MAERDHTCTMLREVTGIFVLEIWAEGRGQQKRTPPGYYTFPTLRWHDAEKIGKNRRNRGRS